MTKISTLDQKAFAKLNAALPLTQDGETARVTPLALGIVPRAAQVGAVADGFTTATDNGAALTELFSLPVNRVMIGRSFDNANPTVGGYSLTSQIWMPWNVSAQGEGAGSRFIIDPNWSHGTVCLLNISSQDVPIRKTPGPLASQFGGYFVDAIAAAANGKFISWAKFVGSCRFHDIHAGGVQKLISQSQSSGTSNLGDAYSDLITIERISTYAQPGTDGYIIDLMAPGDGLRIDQVLTFRPDYSADLSAARRTRSIRIAYKSGVTISNVINGDVMIQDCDAVSASGFHMEDGMVTFCRSSGSLRNAIFYMRGDMLGELSCTPLQATHGDGSPVVNTSFVEWENIIFGYEQLFSGETGYTITKPNFALQAAPQAFAGVVRVRNMARSMKMNSQDSAWGARFGVNCGMPDFDNYSHLASMSAVYQQNYWHIEGVLGALPLASDGLDPVLSIDVSQRVDRKWKEASGTYYYKAQLLYDKFRMIGLTGGVEVPATVVNGGGGPTLFTKGDVRGNMIVRLYRGTVSGAYDHYVDVPILAAARLADSGLDVAGYPWIARTAGVVDVVNSGVPDTYRIEPGERTATSDAYGRVEVIVRGAATSRPTTGSWRRGDKVLLTSPMDDGNHLTLGWVRRTDCTAALPSHLAPTDWAPIKAEYTAGAGSSVQFTNRASTINTNDKTGGRMYFDLTTFKPLWAKGANDNSVWVDAMGATVYTPV
ncbi:MAG: hypothetical protein YHS30scaffold392_18 [Phage 64_12]|nr:MAG: hypothetical protein YHS30scaffold392_18 [Phage 64_12]